MKRRQSESGEIIDIHCHVLPGLDDGSRSMEETVNMLRIAEDEGITEMICTPHYKNGHHNASKKTILERLAEVKEAALEQGIHVKLHFGNEVLFFYDLEETLEEDKIFSLNDSEYMLVEFLPGDDYLKIRNALGDVFGMGYTPVIAHIERYECIVKNPEYAGELSDMGVKIQVNASSVTGEAGGKIKSFVKKLLKEEMVDYIGTDAHRDKGRIPAMKKCKEYLYKKYDRDYIDGLLYKNARRDFLI